MTVNLAYTLGDGQGATNLLLADLAARLMTQGVRLAGTAQFDRERPDTHRCDMGVQVLPDGPVIRISQSLGTQARGCRLDPEALEQAVALTEARLQTGVDLLIVNKFGKHESDGRGFRETIARAAARNTPVLVGANKLNLQALQAFCGGAIVQIDPTPDALLAWARTAIAQAQAA
ncbi:DUF2478 domain-containing protein [Aliisedimentitalea scapharcae]|uniref:DUF2478 domain-containing protein n=1 Tax=Aliisedimentitalea scapharcae TaxID=1524259 RepID=UPI003873BBE4